MIGQKAMRRKEPSRKMDGMTDSFNDQSAAGELS
jgi:hypothetical protein